MHISNWLSLRIREEWESRWLLKLAMVSLIAYHFSLSLAPSPSLKGRSLTHKNDYQTCLLSHNSHYKPRILITLPPEVEKPMTSSRLATFRLTRNARLLTQTPSQSSEDAFESSLALAERTCDRRSGNLFPSADIFFALTLSIDGALEYHDYRLQQPTPPWCWLYSFYLVRMVSRDAQRAPEALRAMTSLSRVTYLGSPKRPRLMKILTNLLKRMIQRIRMASILLSLYLCWSSSILIKRPIGQILHIVATTTLAAAQLTTG